MPTIIYIAHDATRSEVGVPGGTSVMEGAVRNGIAGIIGECGGGMACGTCQVLVEPEWRDRVGEPGDNERNMLEYIERLEPGARLGCQIVVRDELDGLIVRTPRDQHRS